MTDHIPHHPIRWPGPGSPATRMPALPNEELSYLETPESFAGQLEKFVDQADSIWSAGAAQRPPAHIKAVAEMVPASGRGPFPTIGTERSFSRHRSGRVDEANRPLIIGERTNVIGSRLFKNLVGRGEVGGSHRHRALPGAKTAHRSSTSACSSSERDESARHPAVLRAAHLEGQSPTDDRHTPDAKGGRSGAHLLPGQRA